MKMIMLILASLIAISPAHADSAMCGVSPIPKSLIKYDCSCSYNTEPEATSKTYFQSDTDYSNPIMYINGKLVSVKPVKIEDVSANPKIGDKISQTYAYKDIKIKFINTISYVCPANSESCEVMEFSTMMSVHNKHCTAKSIKIMGACGC